MMKVTNEKEWFLKPLYQNRPIRLGNLYGEKTVSGNHGQSPGFVVYKAFTKAEIKAKARAVDTNEFFGDKSTLDNVLFAVRTPNGIMVNTDAVDGLMEHLINSLK